LSRETWQRRHTELHRVSHSAGIVKSSIVTRRVSDALELFGPGV
jgi:hypothetical protein